MNIYIVNSGSCCGKTTYINKNKRENDIIVDMYDYQTFYSFLADLEYYCSNQDENVWVECVVSTRERFNLILDTIYAGINNRKNKMNINIKIIHLRSDKSNLLLMQQLREPNESLEYNLNISNTRFNSQDAIRDLMCSVEYRDYDIKYIFSECR